jgi:hypothetical protein
MEDREFFELVGTGEFASLEEDDNDDHEDNDDDEAENNCLDGIVGIGAAKNSCDSADNVDGSYDFCLEEWEALSEAAGEGSMGIDHVDTS